MQVKYYNLFLYPIAYAGYVIFATQKKTYFFAEAVRNATDTLVPFLYVINKINLNSIIHTKKSIVD